ncbi:hypothetical protein J437_LFUL000514 [Ladona fulva]|uniref:CUB domain-containing protein n=1 Tax=Ladona fulva TaxID=123851 RepID=A0A8K0JSV3_LADFU|nr:hypothetical protein J437_LFUL000514 [Ladona fulva]
MLLTSYRLLFILALETLIIFSYGKMTVSDTSTTRMEVEDKETKVDCIGNTTITSVENFMERTWHKAAEEESLKKGIEIGWEKGVNPLTSPLDCCFGVDEVDCVGQCFIGDTCSLTCGYLLFPENPTMGQKYTTSLSTTTDGLVWLRIAITDLRYKDKLFVSYEKDGNAIAEIICESFTEEEMEKFFTSQKEQLFVTYQARMTDNGELGCSQWETPSKKLYFRAVSKVECHNEEIVIKDADTQGKLFSPPDSSYPPLRDCSWTIRASSAGYGIGLFIDELDLNGFFGDHLRINAGGSHTFIKRGYIFTWSTSPSQQYLKVFPGGMVTLYFHTGRHLAPTKHKGFDIEYRTFGNGTIPDDSTTSSTTLVTPPAGYSTNASLYFAGKTPMEVYKERSVIKAALVNMANTFCNTENISLEEPISFKDIFFHRIMHCPSTWPYSSTCAEVIVQILAHTISGNYELTDYNILKMWERYGYDGNMTVAGVMPYHQDPNAVTWWLVAAAGTLGLFTLLIFGAWFHKKHAERVEYISQMNQSRIEADNLETNNSKHTTTSRKEKDCPIIVVTDEDEGDDISITYDRRDSYYDYDIPEFAEESTHYDNNDGFGLTITGEKVNHAFIPDEEDELDEVDLGREDFKFEFLASNGRRVSQNYDLPIHQRVINIDGNPDHDQTETNL